MQIKILSSFAKALPFDPPRNDYYWRLAVFSRLD